MDEGVATVFGLAFGKHFGTSLRLSFSCTGIEDIDRGIKRMKIALEKCKAEFGVTGGV